MQLATIFIQNFKGLALCEKQIVPLWGEKCAWVRDRERLAAFKMQTRDTSHFSVISP